MSKQKTLVILSSDEAYTKVARAAAETLGAEVVEIDPHLGEETVAAILSWNPDYVVVHGHYHDYRGAFVASEVMKKSTAEVVLMGTSLGWGANQAEHEMIAFHNFNGSKVTSIAQLLREGRATRIQRAIDKVRESARAEEARLQALLTTTDPSSG